MSTILKSVISNRLYLSQGLCCLPQDPKFRFFVPDDEVCYSGYCDDFGPMNLASIAGFISQLDVELTQNQSIHLIYNADKGRRGLANAVFLLGSFLIMKQNQPIASVLECFAWVTASLVEPFRDATFRAVDFELTLEDCWRGLARAHSLSWVAAPNLNTPWLWGKIDMEEYAHYDGVANGDLHVVVPGKFVAFAGPHDSGGKEYIDDPIQGRIFSPGYYASIFRDLGVSDVVRLNDPCYSIQEWADAGFHPHHLPFPDCTAPPPDVVEAFLAAADGARGVVAVHCKAGWAAPARSSRCI